MAIPNLLAEMDLNVGPQRISTNDNDDDLFEDPNAPSLCDMVDLGLWFKTSEGELHGSNPRAKHYKKEQALSAKDLAWEIMQSLSGPSENVEPKWATTLLDLEGELSDDSDMTDDSSDEADEYAAQFDPMLADDIFS